MTPRTLKRIGLSLLVMIVASLAVGIYMDSQSPEQGKYQVKRLEIFESRLSGYKDGAISWTIFSDYIWAGRSRYIYNAEDIVSGKIYNKRGDVILQELDAAILKVNTRHKTLKAQHGVSGVFLRREQGVTTPSAVQLRAENMNYYNATNRAILGGDIELVQEDLHIYPKQRISIDLDEDIAMMEFGFFMQSDDFALTGNHMVMYLDKDMAELSKGVQGRRFALSQDTTQRLDDREMELRQKETHFSAEFIRMLNVEDNDQIDMEGSVMIAQEDKSIQADYASYDEKRDVYVVEGNVILKADSIQWVVDKHKRDAFESDDVSNAIRKPLVLSADRIIFDAQKEQVKVVGDVKVTQDDLLITCDKLEFNDDTGQLLLVGNVLIDRVGADVIRAQKLDINIITEDVIAHGDVESVFDIK